ncbi:MAG: hypothetical protein KAS07_02125 [Candidatus Pacebacteria bacterium]|nr:hypothetical protein [Candidatus Paceibacterota bacterium]
MKIFQRIDVADGWFAVIMFLVLIITVAVAPMLFLIAIVEGVSLIYFSLSIIIIMILSFIAYSVFRNNSLMTELKAVAEIDAVMETKTTVLKQPDQKFTFSFKTGFGYVKTSKKVKINAASCPKTKTLRRSRGRALFCGAGEFEIRALKKGETVVEITYLKKEK